MNDKLFYGKLSDVCHNLLLNSTKIKNYYIKQRSLTEDTIRNYQLGYFPEDLRVLFNYIHPKELKEYNIIWNSNSGPFNMYPIVIPIKDFCGSAVGIGCRTLLNENKRKDLGIPKYRNSSYSKKSHLFGLDKAQSYIRKENLVYVVEGYFDAITAHQNNVKNVVATCGTAFSMRQINLLCRYTNNIVLIFDNDEAGKISSKRVKESLEKTKYDIKLDCIFTPPKYKDLDEFLKKGEKFSSLLEKYNGP